MSSEHVSIKTPEYVSLRFQSANLGSRAIALIIDSIITTILQIVVILLSVFGMSGLEKILPSSEAVFIMIAIMLIVIFIIEYGYFFFFEYFNSGRTIGKSIIGIRVIQEDGHSITLLSSLIRNLLRIIDILPFSYFTGILMIYFHPKNKRLGDLLAGTIVVHERPGKKRMTKLDRLIQARNLPLQDVTLDEVMMRSVKQEEWNLLKLYSDRLLSVTDTERNQLTTQMANALFERFDIEIRGKTTMDLENTLLTLYLLLKKEWDFE